MLRGGSETADEQAFGLVAETETVFFGGVDAADVGLVNETEDGEFEVFGLLFVIRVHEGRRQR